MVHGGGGGGEGFQDFLAWLRNQETWGWGGWFLSAERFGRPDPPPLV